MKASVKSRMRTETPDEPEGQLALGPGMAQPVPTGGETSTPKLELKTELEVPIDLDESSDDSRVWAYARRCESAHGEKEDHEMEAQSGRAACADTKATTTVAERRGARMKTTTAGTK